MSGGGSNNQTYGLPTLTNSVSFSSNNIPSWLTGASRTGISAATNLLNNPGQAYGGQLTPGLTADQQAAGDMIRDNVGASQGYYDQAGNYISAATQAGPQIEAQTLRQGLSGIGDYMNPYIGSVIGGVRQMAADNLAQSLRQTDEQAARAGAFGGSRHGVMEGVATTGANNALNNQIAQLLSGGYNQATNLLGQDISNNFAAQQANQTAYAQYMNRLLGAGSQMSQLGTDARAANVADINNLMQYGSMQQDTATRDAQARYAEFLRLQGLPYQGLTAYNQTVQSAPHSTSGYTSTNGYSISPTQQQSTSPLMGGLGGALSGASMGSYFGPYGTAIGAIGGGLLGAFK